MTSSDRSNLSRFVLLALVAAPLAVQAAPAPEKKSEAKSGDPAALDFDFTGVAPEQPAPAKKEPEPAPAPPPAPVAPAPPPVEPAPEAPVSEAPGLKFLLSPMVSFGTTHESDLSGAASTFGYGLRFGVQLFKEGSISAGFGHHSYGRRYLVAQPSPGSVDVFEHRLAGDLLYGHELLGLFGVKDTRLQLVAQAGFLGHFFVNDVVRSVASGVGLGATFRFAPSDQLDVAVGGQWAYNLVPFIVGAPTGVLNVHGEAKQFGTYAASLGLKLAPGTRFGIGYAGEVYTLAASYRFFHSLQFGFDVAL